MTSWLSGKETLNSGKKHITLHHIWTWTSWTVLMSPNNCKRRYCSPFGTQLMDLNKWNKNEQMLLKIKRGFRAFKSCTEHWQLPTPSHLEFSVHSWVSPRTHCNVQTIESYRWLLEGPHVCTHTWARLLLAARGGSWMWRTEAIAFLGCALTARSHQPHSKAGESLGYPAACPSFLAARKRIGGQSKQHPSLEHWWGMSDTKLSSGSHTTCLAPQLSIFACIAAVWLTVSLCPKKLNLAWVCKLLMYSARGTKMCVNWIEGCLSTWMTTTFPSHIDAFTYTVKFCLQDGESILMAQSVIYLGADSGHGFPMSTDIKQPDWSHKL